ncbi:MAG: hypothetical protein AAF371_17360 [Pseudomonadota bacterium]
MENSEVQETRSSLERIQNFDTSSFDRPAELGASLNTADFIAPANRIIALFEMIPSRIVEEFPPQRLQQLKSQADQIYNIFSEVEKFTPEIDSPTQKKKEMRESISSQYDSVFNSLYHLISYSAARVTDFQSLEADGRAAVQSVLDRTEALTSQLEKDKLESQKILEEIRELAAEQGVTQMASYFKDESEYHLEEARIWAKNCLCWAFGLIVFAVLSLFLHEIDFLNPENVFQSYQLIVSKVLIFLVLSFMLILAARSFIAHRHNATVNKHRQNALMTYKAFVDAGGTPDSRDTILKHAAASVFSPQDTGYTKGSQPAGPSASTLVELSSHGADIAN